MPVFEDFDDLGADAVKQFALLLNSGDIDAKVQQRYDQAARLCRWP